MTPQLEELACLYVLDQLDPSERAAFETRLAHDDALATLVREFETALAERIRLLPPHRPRADLLARIEAQLDTPAQAGRGLPTPPFHTSPRLPSPPPPAFTDSLLAARPPSHASPRVLTVWPTVARWTLAAAAAIALGAGTFFFLERHRAADAPPMVLIVGLDPQHSTVTPFQLREGPTGPDARFVQLASLAEQFWTSPENLPHGSSSAGSRHAYALFDPTTRQGFIAVQQLPAPADGKRYHLWLVDPGASRVIDAGSLPAATSRGLYFFTIDPATAPTPGPLDFLITAEDTAPTSPLRPRGEPILGQNPSF